MKAITAIKIEKLKMRETNCKKIKSKFHRITPILRKMTSNVFFQWRRGTGKKKIACPQISSLEKRKALLVSCMWAAV